ncbi:MAG TPA: DUF1569 domain-containing protein [Tepidisphaeraceae bacterium]|nr:DUF1569 domain-containing protein [Tepidisphaeraceae bacterium]
MPSRRHLRYANLDELNADVRRLREHGYERCGTWSLEQACWHLNRIMRSMMRPGHRSPNTPQHDAARPMLLQVMESEMVPSGIEAPEMVRPPAEVPASAVDEFLETNEALKAFAGEFATHRLFGNLSNDEILKLHLIHSAHHFSHLVPKV